MDIHTTPFRTRIVVGAGILFVGLLGILILTNVSLAAQAADAVARPILGEKNTLYLESLYFGLQDKLYSVRYTLAGQHAPLFSPGTRQDATNSTSHMDITRIPPLAALPPLPHEGEWVPISQNLYPHQTIIARTFIRPDGKRPYAVVSLVQMDMSKLGLGAQAGTYYPGGTHGVFGPGVVPQAIQRANGLLAVFNGGFQEKDGHYGMVVGGQTYVPLQRGMPTLFLHYDGSVQLTLYTGQTLAADIASARQNGPYLIHNGTITPFVEQGLDTWGRTTTNSMYTWRSGVGITRQGNLVYAVGNSLVPATLAAALLKAGAVNALQLDINPFWVRFILYTGKGNGQYAYTPLLASMHNGGSQYLHGYNKDFFYVYKK